MATASFAEGGVRSVSTARRSLGSESWRLKNAAGRVTLPTTIRPHGRGLPDPALTVLERPELPILVPGDDGPLLPRTPAIPPCPVRVRRIPAMTEPRWSIIPVGRQLEA